MQLHVTSLPSGRLDRDAYAFVDWLAAAGQSWWQVLPLGPPDALRLPVPVPLGLRRHRRRCSPIRTRPVSAGEEDDLLRARALLDRRLGAPSRAAGARSPTRCASSASGSACAPTPPARGAADRRHAALRRGGQRRPPRASRALPARARRRRAARRLRRRAASAGATRSTTGPRCAAAATAGGSSGCGARSRSSTSCASTTSAASSPTGRSRRAPATRAADAGAAARAARRSRPPARELGELPLIAEDLGADHAGGASALRDALGFPGMVVLQFGFEPAAARTDPIGGADERTRRSTPGPTITRRCQGGGASSTASVRERVRAALREHGIRWQRRRARPYRADPPRLQLARDARDDPARRTCSASAPRGA